MLSLGSVGLQETQTHPGGNMKEVIGSLYSDVINSTEI